MTEENKYLPETQKFLNECVRLAPANRNVRGGNERISHAAFLYEKFRTAIEYQEDHLIFKNAVSRIARRKFALSFSVTSESLFNDLMNELAWADYLNLDSLSDEELNKIKSIVERYLILIHHVKSSAMSRYEAQKIVIGWMASEIDEVLFSHKQQDTLVDFTYHNLIHNLHFDDPKEKEKSHLQLKLAILTQLYRPDYSYAQYWAIKKLFPAFDKFGAKEAEDIALHFDNIIKHANDYLHNPLSKNYLFYTKKYIAPFVLMKELINSRRDLSPILTDSEKFKFWLMELYDLQIRKNRARIWRGTLRALIFIIITKISLAFLIEMPFDQYFKGSVDYFSLLVNVLLPPSLMLLAGLSIKNPPLKNRDVVYQAISNIVLYEKIDQKPFIIGYKRTNSTEIIFNSLFTIFNLAIIAGVIYLLDRLGFNFVSITLFFIFVSAVSFFSFRIRNIALEMMMQFSRENPIISSIEFIFMPFILIGKYLSAAITKSNPFTITLDFLIEAPLKSIITITNSWMRFIRQKKDDIDI